jgi:hypothetical protein
MSRGHKPIWQRMLEWRNARKVAPKSREARKKARLIEIRAVKAVLAEAGEPQLKVLMRQWLAQKPVLPPKADPFEVFLGQVARRLQQHDDEEALLLLM